jgi:hypothetical protein
MKTVKSVMVFCLLLLLLASASGCGKTEAEQAPELAQSRQVETVKPNENDGQIYRGVEAFIRALVKDDRETVLSLLTKGHASTWRDDSFLFNEQARERYDEFAVDNLNYTVVTYINNEDTNFVPTAFIVAVYDVVMKNGGVEASRVKLQESMAFHEDEGQWKIALDERGLLVKKE